MAQRFLITGGQGFLGAHVAKRLFQRKANFLLTDVGSSNTILKQVFEEADLKTLQCVQGDIRDWKTVENLVNEFRPTSIIHLAALQVPACRTEPIRGAEVNVIGHLNVFEAAKRYREKGGQLRSIIYASSAAITGLATDYKDHDKTPLEDDAHHVPKTHYGVFKTANEGNSRVYWLDHKLPSVGIRPLTVFGVGRELGITSGPTKAIKAAILGRPYEIGFTGKTSFNYIEDVADVILRLADINNLQGAPALNMAGPILSVEEYLQLLFKCVPEAKGLITIKAGASALPLAYNFYQKGLEKLLPGLKYTSMEEAIKKIANTFRKLHKSGNLHDRDLLN